MILETIVTTVDSSGRVNLAPMGVVPSGDRILLQPYRETTTYRNLLEVPAAVIHQVDDATIYAYSALGAYQGEYRQAERISGAILTAACSWTEVEVESMGGSPERASASCRVVHTGRIREFVGYNRARNAILEATILATRVRFLPQDELRADLNKLEILVDKCGDDPERQAMAFIMDFVRGCLA